MYPVSMYSYLDNRIHSIDYFEKKVITSSTLLLVLDRCYRKDWKGNIGAMASTHCFGCAYCDRCGLEYDCCASPAIIEYVRF